MLPAFLYGLGWFSAVLLSGVLPVARSAETRPNILWLTSEDHGPHMGCYGDAFATTPNVDRLAARGLRYTCCWSNAPVCAPARTTIISGMYPPSTGSEHMRSMVPFPQGKQMFPVLLRESGYYCTNNNKEDYNLAHTGKVWDESTPKAHWKNRAAGQPFFAVFNSGKSHESQIRGRPHRAIHDPAKVRVPAYHPDTPEVRQDWAQYYDQVSAADADAGQRLAELEEAGLAEDTIVFYYADHGSGMPRNKRWPYNSGLQVPLVVYIPQKFQALRSPEYQEGGTSTRPVSFVDLAPTMLSLAGIQPPEWLQGHAFLGAHQKPVQEYVYGFRGRMDERYDLVRSITDGRYVYIRNYRPDLIYGQYLDYMWGTPTTRVWEQKYLAGELNAAQSIFWKPKAPEELYDLQSDRDEVQNLAGSTTYAEVLERLRSALRAHTLRIRDVGFLPEGDMHRRSAGTTPYDLAQDPARYPLERIYKAAELASSQQPEAQATLGKLLGDEDSAVRYWAVLGLRMRGADAVQAQREVLQRLLTDPAPEVRIAAAEILGRFGAPGDRTPALELLLQHADWKTHDVFTVMAALNALVEFGSQLAPVAERIAALPDSGPAAARYKGYPARLLQLLGSPRVQRGRMMN